MILIISFLLFLKYLNVDKTMIILSSIYVFFIHDMVDNPWTLHPTTISHRQPTVGTTKPQTQSCDNENNTTSREHETNNY